MPITPARPDGPATDLLANNGKNGFANVIVGANLTYDVDTQTLSATGSSEAALILWQAAVDGVGTNPNCYATLSAATASGATRILITANYTETSNVSISANTLIYIFPGVTATFGAYRISVASNVSISVTAQDITSVISSTPSANNNHLIFGGSSTAIMSFSNISYVNNSTSYINTGICESSILILSNCKITAGNAANCGANFAHYGSYSEYCTFITGGTGSTNAAVLTYGTHYAPIFYNTYSISGAVVTMGSGAVIENGIYDSTTTITIDGAGTINGLIPNPNGGGGSCNLTNISGSSIYEYVNLGLGTFATGAYGVITVNYLSCNAVTTNSISAFNLWNNVEANTMTISGNNNTITNSIVTTTFTNSGTGTVRTGNNSVIGNDYAVTTTGTFTMNWSGIWTMSQAGNLKYIIDGTKVTLLFPAVLATANIPTVIISSFTLSSNLYPATSQYFPIRVLDNNTATTGYIYIQNNGAITIYKDVTGASFSGMSNLGNSGFDATSITYLIS